MGEILLPVGMPALPVHILEVGEYRAQAEKEMIAVPSRSFSAWVRFNSKRTRITAIEKERARSTLNRNVSSRQSPAFNSIPYQRNCKRERSYKSKEPPAVEKVKFPLIQYPNRRKTSSSEEGVKEKHDKYGPLMQQKAGSSRSPRLF